MKLLTLLTLCITSLFFNSLYALDLSERGLLNKLQISLVQAVNIAENEVPGRAVEVEIDSLRRLPVYEITIMTNTDKHEVTVDGIDGRIIKVELE